MSQAGYLSNAMELKLLGSLLSTWWGRKVWSVPKASSSGYAAATAASCRGGSGTVDFGYLHYLFPRSHGGLRKQTFPMRSIVNGWECSAISGNVPWPSQSRRHRHSDKVHICPYLQTRESVWGYSSPKLSQQLSTVSSLLALGLNNHQCSLALWSLHLLPPTSNFCLTYQEFSEPFHFLSLSLLLTSSNTLVSVVELGIESISAFGWDLGGKQVFRFQTALLLPFLGKVAGFHKARSVDEQNLEGLKVSNS